MGQSKDKTSRKYREIAEARSNLYKFLSSFYIHKPTKETVLNIADKKFLKDISEIFPQSAVSLLGKYAKSKNGEFDKIEQDYNDLFIVPMKKFVTPYESVYIEGQMSQETTVKVAKFYQDQQAEITPGFPGNSPDYIGYELDFMRFLCEQEAKAWKTNKSKSAKNLLKAQKEFLENHLKMWIKELSASIEKKADTDFFKSVAKMTKYFITNDAKEVKQLIRESKEAVSTA